MAEGGGWDVLGGTVTLTSSSITGNTVTSSTGTASGAGLAFGNSGGTATAKVTCTSSTVTANASSGPSGKSLGGGLYFAKPTKSATATFDASAGCGFGSGATDNPPVDVYLVNDGTTPTTYSSFGAAATFTCTETNSSADVSTGSCTPDASP